MGACPLGRAFGETSKPQPQPTILVMAEIDPKSSSNSERKQTPASGLQECAGGVGGDLEKAEGHAHERHRSAGEGVPRRRKGSSLPFTQGQVGLWWK